LISKEQRRNGWSGTTSYNGWPVSGELIQDYLNQKNGGFNDLAFYLEVQSRDTDGNFCHHGWGHGYKFVDRFNESINRHGGQRQTSKAVPLMLDELARAIGDRDFEPLAFGVYDLFNKYPAGGRLELLSTVDTVAEAGGESAELALFFGDIGRFFLLAANLDTVSAGIKAKVPEPDRWRERALATVGNPERVGSQRMPLANLYADRGLALVDEPLALEMGRAVADAMEADHDFNGWNLLHTLRAFVEIEQHPEWEAITRRIVEGWWEKNRHNSASRNTGKAFDPLSSVIFAALDIELRLNSENVWSNYRREFGDTVLHNPTCAMLLVEHGHWEDATDMLQTQFRKLDANRFYKEPRYFETRLTRERLSQVDQYLVNLESDESPDLAAFARCLLLATPDPKAAITAEYPEPWKGRTGRLLGLANQLKTHKWGEQAFAEASYTQLAIDPQAARVSSEAIGKLIATRDYARLIGSNNYRTIELGMRLPAAFATAQIMAGDTEVMLDIYDEIRQTKTGRSHYRNEAYEELARRFYEYVQRRAFTLTEQQRLDVIEVCQYWLEDYGTHDNHFNDHEFVATVWVAMVAWAGREKKRPMSGSLTFLQ
ncbi:MAG: hypothetical protein AAF236_16095, partial [Verrucomicrobiota bacterium]